MKSVSTDFKLAQTQPSIQFVRQAYYKRRYWQASTKTYIWETNWTALTEAEVATISSVNWQLDTQELNKFSVSNVTIVAKNANNEWLQNNYSGRFALDLASPYGYEAFWTKFQIKAGFILAGGTSETVAIFTGLATDYNFDSDQQTCQINIEGLETMLVSANAEDVSTTVSDENMGTGNGSNKVFTTVQPGVGIVMSVSDNGLNVRIGTDVQISNLGATASGATITFTTAPLTGHVIRATYLYWYQGTSVTTLVKSLLTTAGIPSVNQIVDSIILASTNSQQFIITTQADWDAGVKTTCNTIVSPGDLKIDFGDTSFKTLASNFTSGIAPFSQLAGSVTNVSGKMRLLFVQNDLRPGVNEVDTHQGIATYLSTKASGVWQFDYTPPFNNWELTFAFMAQTVQEVVLNTTSGSFLSKTFGAKIFQGYAVMVNDRGSGTGPLKFIRCDAAGVQTVIASTTVDTSTTHTVRIDRHPVGTFHVFYDGTLLLTVSDSTYKTSVVSCFQSTAQTDIDNVYYPSATVSCTWVSPTKDASTLIQSWGLLSATLVNDNGNTTYATKSSADDITYDAYIAAFLAHNIPSLVKRYIKLQLSMSAVTNGIDDPTISEIDLQYYISATFTVNTLADFTGQTVFDAISNYGAFSNYEWGFNPDETFFFRNKSTTKVPALLMNEKNYVTQVISTSNGYDRVYSEVEVTYGTYDILIKSDVDQLKSPTLRFGKRRLSVSGSGILIPTNDNVATAIAMQLFARYSQPRRLFKIKTLLLPQLDLSDVVQFTFCNSSPDSPWSVGDTSKQLGDLSLQLYGESQQLAFNLLCKVIGIRFDTEGPTCEIDLEEILL